MPIKHTVLISKEIFSLQFNYDDTLVVSLIKSEDGKTSNQESYLLPENVVKSLLDVPPQLGYTIRESIVSSIYNHLISSGLVEGSII